MPPALSDLSAKKGRHRHTPVQLSALNELYDQDEHPSLESRVSLAEKLDMEMKTVNAWFQNKRASSKKRTTSKDSLASNIRESSFQDTTMHIPEHDDNMDSSYPNDLRSLPVIQDQKRTRIIPSLKQLEELTMFVQTNSQPTIEEKHTFAEQIGMPYQSVSDWLASPQIPAQKVEDQDAFMSETLIQPTLPPAPTHPSLNLAPVSTFDSPERPRRRRSDSISSSHADETYSPSSRRSQPRRSSTPYGYTRGAGLKRSRPEPYQLEALRDLYNQTSTPSVEDRAALAQEIGMDTRRVTNWFRNVRQSSRKKSKKPSDGDDDEYGSNSAFVSRAGSPASSSVGNDFDMHQHGSGVHSSEEDDQEAVTPPPESSPAAQSKRSMLGDFNRLAAGLNIELSRYPGFDMDQVLVAHCLIDFHSRIVN